MINVHYYDYYYYDYYVEFQVMSASEQAASETMDDQLIPRKRDSQTRFLFVYLKKIKNHCVKLYTVKVN